MIIDTMANSKFYRGLNPDFEYVFNYIKQTDFAKILSGTYQLRDGVYYMIQEYETKPESEGTFEAHRKFIDVQYILEGSERHDYAALDNLKQKGSYNEEKDVVFYEGSGISLLLEKGTFAVYFPQDAHMPNLRTGSMPVKMKKAVFKIPVFKAD